MTIAEELSSPEQTVRNRDHFTKVPVPSSVTDSELSSISVVLQLLRSGLQDTSMTKQVIGSER